MVDASSITIFVVLMALFLLGISLVRNKRSVVFSKSTPWKKKLLVIATPSQPEKVLLFFALFSFTIMDLANNKAVDLGSDYRVIVFGNITALAVDVWLAFLIIFHIFVLALFLMSLKSKETNRVYDIFVGGIAFFSIAVISSGFLLQLYNAESVRFLGIIFDPVINYYHAGVYGIIFCLTYWAFTR